MFFKLYFAFFYHNFMPACMFFKDNGYIKGCPPKAGYVKAKNGTKQESSRPGYYVRGPEPWFNPKNIPT